MDTQDTIKNIRRFIRRPDKLPEAFDLLENLLQEQFAHRIPEFASLRVSFFKNETDWNSGLGTIEREVYMLEFRRAIQALEELLTAILREEKRNSGQNMEMGSELSKVSCDRAEILKRFWRSFDEREDAGLFQHFYFLNAQAYGEADSIVRRLIANLKTEKKQVKFSGIHKVNIRKIDLAPADSLADFQHELRRAFNRGLYPQVRNLAEFIENIDATYPAYKRALYLPFVFDVELQASCWERLGVKGLRWFIQEFCKLSAPADRRLVYFFIIETAKAKTELQMRNGCLSLGQKKENKPPVSDLTIQLESLTEIDLQRVTILPPLKKVVRADLDDWYDFYEPNQVKREEKVEELISRLGGGEAWHMSHVEKELAQIVETYQNAKMGI